jgi:glycerophosphoryl diester phosphodiesterase
MPVRDLARLTALPFMKKIIIRSFLAAVAVAATAYLVAAWNSTPRPDHPFFTASDGILVIAHRGGAGLAPENTLEAFGRADSLGADVLEFDLRLSADGAWVVIHDARVDRTTNGQGEVEKLNLRQLKALDAGYHWKDASNPAFPYRGRGIEVPTLAEVLQAFPGRRFNIEIKIDSSAVVDSFCRRLEIFDAVENSLIASFHPSAITAVRQKCGRAATAATRGEALWFFALNRLGLDAAYSGGADAMQVPVRLGRLAVADQRFVAGARRHNMQVHPWTVNDIQAMQTLLEAGADGIITNYPDRLLRLLGRLPAQKHDNQISSKNITAKRTP